MQSNDDPDAERANRRVRGWADETGLAGETGLADGTSLVKRTET
jgi:hypothetical protein